METKQIIEILNEIKQDLNKIISDANSVLSSINKTEEEREKNTNIIINNMYDCDLRYYRDVARYAWGERGKIIAVGNIMNSIKRIENRIISKNEIIS